MDMPENLQGKGPSTFRWLTAEMLDTLGERIELGPRRKEPLALPDSLLKQSIARFEVICGYVHPRNFRLLSR
jgi:hypothetical protein